MCNLGKDRKLENTISRMHSICSRYKEVFLYLFFGGLTFLISVISYMIFVERLQIRPILSNFVSWLIAVLFAFFTNRTWVFDGQVANKYAFAIQLVKFAGARVFTLFIEELMLWFFVEQMRFHNLGIKIVAQIIVILLNYILSKMWVFV